jgi:hypothetical protein
MGLKKGIYFTIDSAIAGTIILIAIVFTSFFYIKEPQNVQINFASHDLITILSTLNVKEINNEHLNLLISSEIVDILDSSVLEQVVRFWAEDNIDEANRTIRNITEPWLDGDLGFSVLVSNETIYSRDLPVRKSLVSSKSYISGFEKGNANQEPSREAPPSLWGPAEIEVRVWE